MAEQLGSRSSWVPFVGDFNGDGVDDIAVWHSATGTWLVALSDGGHFVVRPSRSMVARRPGFSDLYVVRDEWVKYEAGEIALIENVMASETRSRKHTRLDESETTFTTVTESTKVDERDTQTTDRSDLHNEASNDSRLNVGVEGQVDTSGQYGPTHVNTHLGGSFDYSLNQSESHATTIAHETVARAVTRVEEKIQMSRTTRSLTRIEEINEHSFKNDSKDAQHISGIYRWVDKIKRLQIFRYPNRFLLEFQVPEPGAWLRWLLDNKKPETISENPLPFTKDGTANTSELTFDDIDRMNYAEIAARYKTIGIEQYPEEQKIIAIALTKDAEKNPSTIPQSPYPPQQLKFTISDTLMVPSGYQAISWSAIFQECPSSYETGDKISVQMAVGSGPPYTAEPNSIESIIIPLVQWEVSPRGQYP